MTATERLRELLDERGVEWDGETCWDVTYWNEETNLAVASEGRDEKLWVSMRLTPEQAVEATLGRGTCHNINAGWPSLFECDECGYSNDDTYCGSECHFKFCPNCGAKVVDD